MTPVASTIGVTATRLGYKSGINKIKFFQLSITIERYIRYIAYFFLYATSYLASRVGREVAYLVDN